MVAGTVINAKDVTGSITVSANNVTIQNSKIHTASGSSYKGIDVGNVTGAYTLGVRESGGFHNTNNR